MSLNYDLSKCRDLDELFLHNEQGKREGPHGYVECVIFGTMAMGTPLIVETNVDEVWRRAAILQAIHGPWLSGGLYVTQADVYRLIGLKTNVVAESPRDWDKRMRKEVLGSLFYRVDTDARHQETVASEVCKG